VTDAHTVISTPEEEAFEQRGDLGAIWTASRLIIGIVAFAFASLGFAYFYLRSTNNSDLWRPHGVTAPTTLGLAILISALVATGLSQYGTWRYRRGSSIDWAVSSWIALMAGLLATGLQIYEFFRLHFYPGSSGYASCFIGWAVLNTVLLLSGVYWLETILARRLRAGAPAEGSFADRKQRAQWDACNYYWGFIGLVSLVFWLMFYVI
jgi:heme/copper-type cytochrome/quinol oxidase subunit 3